MCGINGIIKFNQEPVLAEELKRMNEIIKHRGPDYQGIWIDKNIGFGHVRLSIIDLNPRSNQPFIYQHQGKKVILTYNGEIYNFKEIRQELAKEGFLFNTECDTEVLAAAYIRYGVDCLNKFNGMFAFAIYDPQQNIIFAARDRFGQKPFKYYLDQEKFSFSSELKAILTLNNIPREIDYKAIDFFLAKRHAPSPQTGFLNIQKLPSSHFLVFNLDTKKIDIRRYYDLDFSKKLQLSESEWCQLIEEKIIKAIKRRLIADVPLGAFLSGGVDSSAIVAIANQALGRKLQTFSIAFKESDFDESGYARQVATLNHTDHHEFKVTEQDLINNIDKLIVHYEEPYADSSQLPTFILSQLTKRYVTVALSGDGGDEMFGGYNTHCSHLIIKKTNWIWKLINNIVPNSKRLPRHFQIVKKTINQTISQKHHNYTDCFDDLSKQLFYKDDFKSLFPQYNIIFDQIVIGKKFTDMDKVYYLDLYSYLPDEINVKVDMASMLNALEVRSPLLDYEIANLIAQMPYQLKTDPLNGKKIFKKMLEKYLPKNILYRKKMGFGVPLIHWFNGPLKEFVVDTVLDRNGIVQTIMKQEALEQLIKELPQRKDYASKLWTLITLNKWYEYYI